MLSRILLSVGCLAIFATPAWALETGQKFEAWTTKCVDNDAGGQACHIFQRLIIEGEGNQEKDLRMSVGFAPGASNPVTVIRLPLGLWLLNGITLTVDDGQSQRFPVQICAAAGCQTTLQLEAEIVEDLKAGSQLVITSYNALQQPVQIPIDLHGFSEGLQALRAVQTEQ